LAHLIGRGKLFDGFWAGIDPHTVTAAGILGKKTEDVTKDERQYYGKTMAFTIVNGAGWRKVAEMVDCSEREAKRILAKHEKEFPEIYGFKEYVFKTARKRRPAHVRSILGRKRRMPGLISSDYKIRSAAERETFNFLIQGGAADLMKLALIETDYQLAMLAPDSYLSMTVHDEEMAVALVKDAEQVKEIMIEAMTGGKIQRMIKVPLKVDCNIGQRWSECH
jgi:DNA polymerase I-like protein with 3'-5' exonuclease and polymerase domains